jgi:hypothetical protein
MHHITLERTNIIRTTKLNLQLNDEAYKILVEGVNKYPEDDNCAIWEWMKSETCSKYHYNKIWQTFNNRLPGVKLTILD